MRHTAIAILSLLLAASAGASDAKSAEVMFLGTFHFANPGLDFVKGDAPDVLTDERQKEIVEIVQRLKRFDPTKIAVEWPVDRSDELNRRYAAYLAGADQQERSETFQIGFRLAKLQHLSDVHAIDVKGDMDIGAVMAFAQKNDPAFLASFQKGMSEVVAPLMRMQKVAPIVETLRKMNDPSLVARANSMYIEMSRVGDVTNPVGAEQVGKWYARNIKIFANLARLAQPGDRIVVIYGHGHIPLLQQLAREMPGLSVINVNDFLSEGGTRVNARP